MSLAEFAGKQRLKVRRDECNDVIVPGRFGHLYEYSADQFGACIVTESRKTPRVYRWNRARDAFAASGMKIVQSGDAEGCATFSPHNEKHVELILQHLGIRTKRQISPERRKALLASLARARDATKRGCEIGLTL
jgi:hypothetical protein